MVIRIGAFALEREWSLYILIPLAIILFLLIKRRFINNIQEYRKRKAYRFYLFISTLLIFTLLAIAISSPTLELHQYQENIPTVKILVDNTSSMKVFRDSGYDDIIDTLKGRDFVVETDMISTGDASNLGDELLKHISPGTKILFISDGNSNEGTKLEDIALFAASVNSTIFALELEDMRMDAAVIVDGPSKVVAGVENEYTITIRKTPGMSEQAVSVYLDGNPIYEGKASGDKVTIRQTFSSGEHTIKAQINEEDVFLENNVYYRTVNVVKKPRILYVTKEENSPFLAMLRPLYDVDVKQDIPGNLSEYYGVILNNIHGKFLTDAKVSLLEDYVSDENGLIVIGGRSSFDYGVYNTSTIKNILPVSIGQAKKKKDAVNIVISLDTGVRFANNPINPKDPNSPTYMQTIKAMGLSIVDSISSNANIGVIESNIMAESITEGMGKLEDIREDLVYKIPRIVPHDSTSIYQIPLISYNMMQKERGSKNLILVTSGDVQLGPFYYESTLKNAEEMYIKNGMRTYVISLGLTSVENEDSSRFLREVAQRGGGAFYKEDAPDKINILFGDPDNRPKGKPGIFVYDTTHFITEGIEGSGEVYGFNQVYPKSNAQLLLTTTSGDPILTVWRFGLGRVAVISSDDGTQWMSNMMKPANSAPLIRAVNWMIEDPERKNDFKIDFPEFRAHESSPITVRAEKFPVADNLNFFEERKNLYKAYFSPEREGFVRLLNSTVAINYRKEFSEVGMNPNLERVAQITGGQMLRGDPGTIAETIRGEKMVETTQVIDLSWYFVIAAIILYLLEITARKIYEIKVSRNI